MNSVRREFKNKFPRLAANMTLALAFGSIGVLSSVILTNVNDGAGFYSWLVFTFVGGVFLLRALGDVLEMGTKTVELFLKRIGIQQRWSRERIAKDLAFIILTLLAAAAIFPLFKALGTARTLLQSVAAIIATGIVFLFVYDIARAFRQILQEKVSAAYAPKSTQLGGAFKEALPELELTGIKGISSKRSGELKAVDINTVSDLATSSAKDLSQKTGISEKTISSWIEQAREGWIEPPDVKKL